MRSHWIYFALSLIIVTFGQPVWNSWLGLLASCCGFALFWRIILDIPSANTRFWTAMRWYTTVQLIQLFWMTTHPYWYIYLVWFFFAALIGVQFGLLARWIQPANLQGKKIFALAAFWTTMEWVRLFFLSGYTWNPAGLALTGSPYAIQLASVGGIYLLSFLVILINLCFLKSWMAGFTRRSLLIWALMAATPYLFGMAHFHFHRYQMQKNPTELAVLLVQPSFAVNEQSGFKSAEEAHQAVIYKWKKLLAVMKKYWKESIDLIVFPEYLVSYGAYYAVFPAEEVKKVFEDIFGFKGLAYLAPLQEPYAMTLPTSKTFVTNAFFAQSIANLFYADVLVGLEDAEEVAPNQTEVYSAAFHFSPDQRMAERYEKRVLVPMGEYIPLAFLQELAASYGIRGSFTPGKEAKVIHGKTVPFGISICYEETHGHLMRESRLKGAELLVNLTNDGWFPHSKLPQLHFDHARLRSVENGISLVRACNTGVTGAFNSLGETIGILGDGSLQSQNLCDAFLIHVPSYHYPTLYTQYGDWIVLGLCILAFIGVVL